MIGRRGGEMLGISGQIPEQQKYNKGHSSLSSGDFNALLATNMKKDQASPGSAIQAASELSKEQFLKTKKAKRLHELDRLEESENDDSDNLNVRKAILAAKNLIIKIRKIENEKG